MKKDLLIQANYRYNFDRDMFVNREKKKAFSLEFVDEHKEEEIVELVDADTDPGKWTFYFNVPPTVGIQRELERLLG